MLTVSQNGAVDYGIDTVISSERLYNDSIH